MEMIRALGTILEGINLVRSPITGSIFLSELLQSKHPTSLGPSTHSRFPFYFSIMLSHSWGSLTICWHHAVWTFQLLES